MFSVLVNCKQENLEEVTHSLCAKGFSATPAKNEKGRAVVFVCEFCEGVNANNLKKFLADRGIKATVTSEKITTQEG